MTEAKELMPCTECHRKFTVKSNLTRHLRMVHNIQIERIDTLPGDFNLYHFKCLEGCQISYKYNRDLRNHLKTKHELDLVEMNLEFPNSEAFNKWLHNEETTNCVQYVHLTATKRKSTGAETFYYECNRTGTCNRIDDALRKRKPRKYGTTKLNRGCTSQIIVNKSYDGSYSVNYFKSHYGHDIGLEHIKLSKQDRGSIASKLLLGIPISRILHSVKNTSGGDMKRINLLQRKDVFNIRRSFNIPQRQGKSSDKIDAINIQAFVEECSVQDYNPILYHKFANLLETSGEICLIIMTEWQAHMLSKFGFNIVINTTHLDNCDFELITLFIVGENGDSFPAACMFSNQNNYPIYNLFFTKIFERIGKIPCKVLITNCGDIYSKAWEDVMGQIEYKFYNYQQIDLDWKSNLNRILSSDSDVNKVKRKWLYDTLKILQKISDEAEFLESFDETRKLLQNDDDFSDFLVYFTEHFSDLKKWADCYRLDCNVDTKQLEVMTDVLKQYLNEEQEIRLDKIFQSLIRYIRDETVNSMLKNKTNRVGFIQENNTRHQSLTNKQFNSVHVNDDFWNVTDAESGRVYVVEKCLETKCCDLTCSLCHACIHSFSCTCVDFFVSNVICEHIHYIGATYFQSNATTTSENQQEDFCDEEIIIEIDEDVDIGSNTENIELLQTEINQKLSVLQENLGSVNSERSLKLILESVNNLCEFIEDNSQRNDSNEAICGTVMSDHAYL